MTELAMVAGVVVSLGLGLVTWWVRDRNVGEHD
ncbi:hypothetical protein M2152_001983 [Microbacteriaceae bacterium SG_E_30_P1]|uniref:Uncharacterized protein n=1 Tax=Antiquaquibacter oligotrophicus TaxID=2880260 RepID=A0ABT6KP81_9MICO|nr:hypothetical protein [Antiquaquibacter oligotrophicus]